jgi:hypothetical protein
LNTGMKKLFVAVVKTQQMSEKEVEKIEKGE